MFGRTKKNENGAPKKTGNTLLALGELKPDEPFTDLELPDGKVVRLPTHLLIPAAAAEEPVLPQDSLMVPLVEESLVVSKRTVETGKVVLCKSVQEFEQALDEPLTAKTYTVERVNLNRKVTAVPETRLEGTTTIYPVVEERLVWAKELVLIEEVRVTEQVVERRDTQMVKLRREQLDVERVSPSEQ